MKLTTEIPDSLYYQIEQLAEREKITIDQLISIALASQINVWLTQDYMDEQVKEGNWEKFKAILDKVADGENELE